MVDLKRWSTTILELAALILCALPASVAAALPQSPQLVITSATFDASNGRLVIEGQHFLAARGREGHGRASAPPVVTLDLQRLMLISATSTEIVASISGTFPDGTYLITVSRGNDENENGAFAVAIVHQEFGQNGAGPAGPVGAQGPAGQIGPTGAVGPAGSVGPVGPVGPAGPAGAQGLIGVTGASGPQGAQGAIGPQGPPGPQGPQGPQGVAGVSGYQIVTATANNTNLGNGKVINQTAVCPAGTRAVGGGVQQTTVALSAMMVSSYPDTNQSWFAELRNTTGVSLGAITITVYAVCATAN